jgi:hypothetical protein
MKSIIQTAGIIGATALALIQTPAFADDTYSLNGDARTGTLIPAKAVKNSPLPPDKTYDQLSDAEKNIVRSMYQNIPASDEPPFPLNGLKPIYMQIYAGQKAALVRGNLSLDVLIDSTGTPQSVSIYKSPDKDMATYVAIVLMHNKYKPGKCDGVPCKMAYRFDFNFSVDLPK